MRDKKEIQMIVVILSSKRKDRYDAVKRICCIEFPVPSQVVTSAIIDDIRKRKSVVTKVAIQMNCKLGGELWATHIPMKNLMICGIDTYHDSEKKKASVCAFVATTNESKTKYFSRATIQSTHQELSNNLTITVKSACEFYRKVNNGKLPEKVIIYRDGISDGQLKLVTDYEIPQIQSAFSMVELNYTPTLTVIVVKKRGNARFFARKGADLMNPPCGTVIDNTITRNEWYYFNLL
jgi:aubergine